MNARSLLIVAGISAAIAVGTAGGYWLALERHALPANAPEAVTSGSTATAPGERVVLYWYDPMHPEQRFDKPGKSPFMDMQLVPKYADDAPDGTSVSIAPQVMQNLGIRVAKAESGTLEQRFEAVGSVAYNERGVVQLQARASGFVEKLHARAPLDPVKKGAPLVEILYPEWAGAQEEYLLLRRQQSAEMKPLAQAARQRLALLGMAENEIAAVEREAAVRNRFTLHSPISGVVAELGVREGMTVMPGTTLFRLVDLSTVWVNAEVPETQAALVRPGAPVQARVAAYPGLSFEGRVGAILPEVNAATRTLRARIELANPGGRLKPGMYAMLIFAGQRGKEVLLVPSEAVIRTGTRDVVIVALGEGRFRATEVEVGAEARGRSEIRKGLKPGEQVVLSGQFLIDSEASLSGAIARLESVKPAAQGGQAAAHKARGVVTQVDPKEGRIELDHEAIPAMQWPKMKMGFMVQDRQQLSGLKPGDAVQFELRAQPDADGNYVIESIRK